MKKFKKAAVLFLCAVFLVGASVAGTLAYLTSRTGKVENTFTVGKVKITLDETDTDGSTSGAPGSGRDTENKYNLVPDQTYQKDPTIHFQPDSAESYLFALVQNDIEALEPAAGGGSNATIAEQIVSVNGWTELTGAAMPDPYSGNPSNTKVYWKIAPANTDVAAVDYKLFDKFTIDPGVTSATLNALPAGTSVTITAYAIQKAESIADEDAAWAEVKDIAEDTTP